MIIDCLSDLHGYLPEMPGGDLLIIAGDCTATDSTKNWVDFFDWLKNAPYCYKVLVGGNHDHFLSQCASSQEARSIDIIVDEKFEYLKDSGTLFNDLKIWGTPHSLWFLRLNPKCSAFTGNEEYLKNKYNDIPSDIDILVSHSPMYGILDENINMHSCGSVSLRTIVTKLQPKLLVCGHIHENGAQWHQRADTLIINASFVDENYMSRNKFIRVIKTDQEYRPVEMYLD